MVHAGWFPSSRELATHWLAEFCRQRANAISLLFQTQKILCSHLLIVILDTRQPVFKILTMSVPLAAWFEETVGYLSLFSCICLVIPAFCVAHAALASKLFYFT